MKTIFPDKLKKGDKVMVVAPSNSLSLISQDIKQTSNERAEFGDFDQKLEVKTGLVVYRATPYHSWERGTNENWNGLARQFFPKGLLFATISSNQVQRAVRLLNDWPRKRLGYKTPREVFRGCSDSG